MTRPDPELEPDWDEDNISHIAAHGIRPYQLNKEARQWDKEIAEEKPEQTARLIEEAEPFVAHRPPRQPVSLRLDPRDLSLAKRIARGKGIPFTQLMAMWLHERISREKSNAI